MLFEGEYCGDLRLKATTEDEAIEETQRIVKKIVNAETPFRCNLTRFAISKQHENGEWSRFYVEDVNYIQPKGWMLVTAQ